MDAEFGRPCPWHSGIWSALLPRIEGRLPHAMLLQGKAGIGKRRFADAFSARLLCESPVGGYACGACKSCRLFIAGSHPDVLFVVPESMRAEEDRVSETEGGRKQRKASREIRIDDIRRLIAFAGQTAQFGGWRVAVLDPAQAMNTNAANALLKTLEEPGMGTLLMLVSDAPAMLPATVRSRCQPLLMPSPSRSESLHWLAARVGGELRAEELLNAAGTPLRALALLATDDQWPVIRREVGKLLVATLCGEESPVRCAEALASAPEPLLLDWIPGLLLDAVRVSAGAGPETLDNPDLVIPLRRLVEARTTQPLFLLGDDLSRLRQQFLSASGLNRALLWEEVLLRGSHRPARGRQEIGGSP